MAFKSHVSVGRSEGPRFISQIVYPANDLLKVRANSLLVGWNLENFRCSVACTVPLRFTEVNNVLIACKVDLLGLFVSCSKYGLSIPVILGEVIVDCPNDYVPHPSKQAHSIWITLSIDKFTEVEDDEENNNLNKPMRKIKLHSLYSLGCRYETSCYMFGYNPAQTSYLECFHVNRNNSFTELASIISTSKSVSHRGGGSIPWTDLQLIINHSNAADDVRRRILYYLDLPKDSSLEISDMNSIFYTDDQRFESITEKTIYHAITAMCNILSKPVHVWCRIQGCLIRNLSYKYMLLRLGIGLSNWLGVTTTGGVEMGSSKALEKGLDAAAVSPNNSKPSSQSTTAPGISWRDLSLTFAYLHERAARTIQAIQLCGLFASTWGLPAAMKQFIYSEVQSFICLLTIDLILGMVFGWYVYNNTIQIVTILVDICEQLQNHFVLSSLEWFNHSPIGVKLNPIITRKVSTVLTSLVHYFVILMGTTAHIHVTIVRLVACIGCMGITVQLALIVDLLRLLTFHIATIHRVLSSLHHFMLESLHSLWLLFQGQKNNILRKRIDTCHYSQEQLLSGIVLFSAAFFIFPNFAAYFLLFALAQLGCVAIQYIVYAISVTVKEFPYFDTAMYILSPNMQTDGVQFKVQHARPVQQQDTNNNTSSAVKSSVHSEERHTPTTNTSPSHTHMVSQNNASSPSNLSDPTHIQVTKGNLITPIEGLKGILKSQRSNAACGLTDVPGATIETAGVTGRTTRVSFRNSTVRTIPQYLSSSEENTIAAARAITTSSIADAIQDSHEYTSSTDTSAVVTTESGDYSSVQAADDRVEGGDHSSGQTADWVEELRDAPLTKKKPALSRDADERRRRKLALQGRTSLLSSTKPRSSHTTSSTHHSTLSHQRSVTDNVAHIELSPRPIRKTRLFSGYMQHLFYFTDEKGLIFRLLRGVVYGRPALDIQIIHGTCDIFDKRETAARAEIRSICRLITQIKHDRQELIANSSSGTSSTNSVYNDNDNDIYMTMMASSERGWNSTVYWESLRRAVEGCDETDPIVCQQHSQNLDRCMYQDESIEMDSAIGASGSGESVPLLSEVASVVHDRQRRRPYPHSRPCRTYSRRMVAMLLIVLTLQAVVFLCGVGVFVYSCYIEGGRNTATTGTSTSTTSAAISTTTNSLTVATQRGLEETASSQLFATAAASTTTSALHSESKCRNLSVQESRVLSPLYEFFEQIPTPSSTGSSSNSGSSSSGTYS